MKNSIFKLFENARNKINCAKAEDAIKIYSNKMNIFVNIIDIREVTKSSRILGAKYLPSVMLKFCIDTNSQYYKKFLNESFNFIIYCFSDWCSAFATIAATNIGFLNTSNLICGYNRWLKLNDPIEEAT